MAASDPQRRLAYFAWFSVCIIWGTTYLAIRIALETIPPALLGGLRFLVAGLILCVLVRALGHRFPPLERWPRYALLGALLLGVGNGAVVWAEQWIPSGIAAVGVAALPFWMAASETAFGGARVSRHAVLGLALGFAGIVVLIWPSLFVSDVGSVRFGAGVLLVQLACVGWSIGSSLSKRTSSETTALAASALQQLFGGLLMVVVGTVLGEWQALTFTPRTLAAELYLIVFGSLAAYSAYLYALEHLPIATVSLYAYINPIIAVLLGALVAGEPFTPRIAAAVALVLAGVAVVRRASRGGS